MEFSNKVLWDKGLANNQDPYGNRCYTYAQDWAELMEIRMKLGESIEQCAEETSRIADTDGITGYMYGAAVLLLSSSWSHGEVLRKWHNLNIQIGKEGEKANESGGVLNPAIMTIGE